MSPQIVLARSVCVCERQHLTLARKKLSHWPRWMGDFVHTLFSSPRASIAHTPMWLMENCVQYKWHITKTNKTNKLFVFLFGCFCLALSFSLSCSSMQQYDVPKSFLVVFTAKRYLYARHSTLTSVQRKRHHQTIQHPLCHSIRCGSRLAKLIKMLNTVENISGKHAYEFDETRSKIYRRTRVDGGQKYVKFEKIPTTHPNIVHPTTME